MDFDTMDKIFIRDLLIRCIIGIYPEERTEKQDVIVNLTLYTNFTEAIATEDIDEAVNYHALQLSVMEMVENSSFLLVEKLAQAVADLCLETKGVQGAKVRIEKPTALKFCKTVGVEIFRTAK